MSESNFEIPKDFLNLEIRNGYEVTQEAKKIWAVELDLLEQFDKVCNKHNLKYYADSGTLLGAVRENGFIPWDDDIDVVMMRNDYDYLIKNCGVEFNAPYFLQSAYSDENYFRGHAQLRNSNTSAMMPDEFDIVKFNQGIFLDIFPLDYLPQNDCMIENKIKRLFFYRRSFADKMYGVRTKNIFKKICKKIVRDIVFRKGDHNAFKTFERICQEPEGTYVDKVSYYKDISKFKHIPYDYFGEPVLHDFEFTKIPIPNQYDKILRMYYGDNYMTPVKAKAGHQVVGNLILDPDIPYTRLIHIKKEKINETD